MSVEKKLSGLGNDMEDRALRAKILEAVSDLRYGQVTIMIKSGKVTQIDRTEKQRYTGVEGTYGDGI